MKYSFSPVKIKNDVGVKGLLPPTGHELLRCKAAPAIYKHSKSVDLLRKSLLSHVWRVQFKALSCKHERLFDLDPGIIKMLSALYHFFSRKKQLFKILFLKSCLYQELPLFF